MANGKWQPRQAGSLQCTTVHTGPRGDGSESVEENWKRSVSTRRQGSVGQQGCPLLRIGRC